jgi:alpha-glucuronidase
MITARLPFLTKMRWIVFLLAALSLHAETGRDAWLRYPLSAKVNEYRATTPAVIFTSSDSPVVATAEQELVRGFRGLIGRTLRMESHLPEEDAIVLTTGPDSALQPDGYLLKTSSANGHRYITISATTDRGVLYGAFALLRRVQLGESIASLNETQSPIASVRWVNQWDNLDGSIERGYGGRSIFWEGGHVRSDLTRVSEYGRLLASLGINGCAINNVNADRRMLSADFLPQIAKIAGALRPWGVRVVLSVDFASPQSTGGLKTFDPLDPIVSQWWQDKIDQLYVTVPDLAGLLMKADSEGRAGPSFYHRTHADAANMIARALKPHGGLILYRGFVYDHHMDWLNPRNDRARAAYDNFHSLDGQFADNAILQIKNGPIDFQVREPVSPLIAALKKTNQALELQITQEYTGQARHSVCLIPMWKDVLDSAVTPTTRIGLVGVANVGLSDSWLGNQLSLANLYGFGKLAWNPGLTSQQIIDEWTRLTFGTNPTVDKTIDGIQLTSWRTYENYTGPLGLQTLTDIVGNHYGANGTAPTTKALEWIAVQRPVRDTLASTRRNRLTLMSPSPLPRTTFCYFSITCRTPTFSTTGRPSSRRSMTRTMKALRPWNPMCGNGSRLPAWSTSRATTKCSHNSNIRPGKPKFGAMPSPAGSSVLPESRIVPAAWVTISGEWKRSQCG